MGLFDIFKPKTVEARYKTLLELFRRSHRTFRITRNEKYIVEFTFGNENYMQAWSIQQYFDEQKINAGNFTYDFSRKVTITVHSSVDGHPVDVAKTFDQSINQTVMYNTIMQAFFKECAKVADSIYSNEIEKEIQEEKQEEKKREQAEQKQTVQSKPALSPQEEIMQNVLIQALKKKGLDIDKEKLQEEYNKLSNEVYNGSKDDEVDLLSIDQKYALLILAVSLCFSSPDSPNILTEGQRSALEYFVSTLKLNKILLSNILEQKHYLNIEEAIKDAKTIHMDGPFINFIFTCSDIMKEANDDYHTSIAYTQMLKDIGFSQEDIDATFKGKYNYRFEGYKEEKNNKSQAKIIKTFPLLDFVRDFGPKVEVCDFVSKDTNKSFKGCKFTKQDGTITLVSFGKKLGELTPEEIVAKKYNLKVSLWTRAKDGRIGYTLYE